MALPAHKMFGRDTYAERAERFAAIQMNFSTYQAELAAPAGLNTWAQSCATVWNDLRVADAQETNEGIGATTAYNEALEKLSDEYHIAKRIGEDEFENDEDKFQALGFHKMYPRTQDAQVIFVEALLTRHAAMVADGMTPLLSATLVTRLQTAITAVKAAFTARTKELLDATNAKNDLQRRYDDDTIMLGKLLNRWYGARGKKDPDIVNLGMVNDAPRGGGQPPAIPVATYAEPNMNWAAVANATSYDAETSTDSGATTDDVLSAENVLTVVIPRSTTEIWARVRSRNANGVSNWGPWVIIPAIVALAPGNPTYIPPANGNAGKTICVVPPEAIAVRMFYQADGHPKSEIGLMTDGVYEWTLWLTPGTIFLQAEYPGGVVSAEVSLRVE